MMQKELPVNPTQNVMFALCADTTSNHLRIKVILVILNASNVTCDVILPM